MALKARSRPPVITMQHGREGALPRFLFQNPRHIGVGFARMDDQRQPGFARGRNMLAKALCLRVARALVVVIVEAGLADRHDFRIFRQSDQRFGVDIQFLMRVVRMGADRAENLRKFLRDRQHLRKFAHARADGDQARDAGGARARDHRVELGGEIRKIQVAVAIDEHLRWADFRLRRLAVFGPLSAAWPRPRLVSGST